LTWKLNEINNYALEVNAKKNKKVGKTSSVQIKQENVEKHKRGVKTSAPVIEYGLLQSTICMTIQQKDKCVAINVKDTLTRTCKGWVMTVKTSYHVDM
jgi:hypothetical protein